ncbi:sigma-54 dependent transcriptional regulator [Vibrio mediterranei]|uniref:Sigma-54-dependent Fis family transcriptional regulator n=1 Tax=Vibrio mediterranei TaxID=689 RepID=A0AAN1FD59_9VIBR|nr:sigma-54 dependent transcriptional regulator [Vibrio mediterranei]ASI88429.1 sigma-54-dependent Fis family transcriptional regulator [Vibrio mediterranei]MCG9624050.1 sigma-54 dependent transcriptional regulator [Vibrio mediterranei]NOI21965.1 sigma-54-dependent Fis family transcriptional regulator [Vibrio mediterranei]
MTPKVLLIEDSSSLAVLYKQFLQNEPYELLHVATGAEAKRLLERTLPSLIILDLQLPDMQGDEILEWMEEKNLQIPVIVATAHGSVDTAVKLIQKGAKDFLEKPIRADRLKTSVNIHLKQVQLETMLDDIQQQMDRERFHDFIGASIPMQGVYKIIDAVADTNASVFIIGESGTGKEVCANAIHNESERREQPFIAINCGAIPKDLMESEVFGHVKGAFTGATTDRKGAASLAHGGTLFLDELCEMDLEMQKKLLRFLQTGTFTPLGATKEQKVDVRIICATNRDPLAEVKEGRFREDLYYRVHVVPVHMPPLREREHDIVTLAEHFLKGYAKQDKRRFESISKEAQRYLRRYDWPGNVRQLQNVIRNIVVLNDDKSLGVNHLPADMLQTRPATVVRPNTPQNLLSVVQHPIPESTTDQNMVETVQMPTVQPQPISDTEPRTSTIRPMWQVERETIQQAIDFCDGNVLNAAVLLELSPSTVYRKKQAWEAEDSAS